MRIRYLFGILLVSAFAAGSVPLPSALICLPGAAFLTPTAQAAQIRTKIRSLLDRVLGRSMPDGIYKTNGRIEATQVVVAAKYLGRLTDITALMPNACTRYAPASSNPSITTMTLSVRCP